MNFSSKSIIFFWLLIFTGLLLWVVLRPQPPNEIYVEKVIKPFGVSTPSNQCSAHYAQFYSLPLPQHTTQFSNWKVDKFVPIFSPHTAEIQTLDLLKHLNPCSENLPSTTCYTPSLSSELNEQIFNYHKCSIHSTLPEWIDCIQSFRKETKRKKERYLYVTILRNPVERVLAEASTCFHNSPYAVDCDKNYKTNTKSHDFNSLSEFIFSSNFSSHHNRQLQILSGASKPTCSDLSHVKELMSKFFYVILYDDYVDSVKEMMKKLLVSDPSKDPNNRKSLATFEELEKMLAPVISQIESEREEIERLEEEFINRPESFKELTRRNSLDIELYNYFMKTKTKIHIN